jgi:hypothetical protein
MLKSGLHEATICALIVNYPQLLYMPEEQAEDLLRMLSRFSSGIDIKC